MARLLALATLVGLSIIAPLLSPQVVVKATTEAVHDAMTHPYEGVPFEYGALPWLALLRGRGWCSQHALIVAELLNRWGYEARVIGLDGHVVATAEVRPGEWWILDADSNHAQAVVMPFDLATIERDTTIVIPYYPDVTVQYVGFYGAEGNRVRRVEDYTKSRYMIEWLLRVWLILSAGWAFQALGKRIYNGG